MIVLFWARGQHAEQPQRPRHDGDPRPVPWRPTRWASTPSLYKTVTFGISAAYTGIAGALSASAIAFVAPDSFGIFLSIKFLIGLVVGGIGSLAGSVVGGIFYVLVDNSAQSLTQFVSNDLGLPFDLSAYTVFGVLLIALMYLMPMGIAGGVYMAYRKLRGCTRRRPGRSSSESRRKAAFFRPESR